MVFWLNNTVIHTILVKDEFEFLYNEEPFGYI